MVCEALIIHTAVERECSCVFNKRSINSVLILLEEVCSTYVRSVFKSSVSGTVHEESGNIFLYIIQRLLFWLFAGDEQKCIVNLLVILSKKRFESCNVVIKI